MFEIFAPLRDGYRGILLAVTIGACALFLSEHYGAPVMLFALLIGIAFNFLSNDPRCKGGIEFSAKHLLRIGVALLGFRLSMTDVLAQGWQPIAAIVSLVAITLGAGFVLSRFLGRSWHLGLLTGGAVAICGASAALAISAVMQKRDDLAGDTLFTVIAVTTLSTVAMVLYPLLFGLLGFDDQQAGFLIGATIHDVAQVVGAGYSISDEAGTIATLTKLQRVLLLPIVVVAVLMLSRTQDAKPVGVPAFVIAFIAFVAINSTGMVPQIVVDIAVEASRLVLITAIAALGVKTSIAAMLQLGPRHIALVVSETLILLFAAIAIVSVLMG